MNFLFTGSEKSNSAASFQFSFLPVVIAVSNIFMRSGTRLRFDSETVVFVCSGAPWTIFVIVSA